MAVGAARVSRATTTTTTRTSVGRRLTIIGATVLVWLAVAGLFVLVVGGARSGEGSSGGSLNVASASMPSMHC